MEKKAGTTSQGIAESLTDAQPNGSIKSASGAKANLPLDSTAVELSSPQLAIQGIYTKNHQLIIHRSPREIVEAASWSPKIDFKANPRWTDLGSEQYEVALHLHLTAQQVDQSLFEIDLEQAGLFTLQSVPTEQRAQVLYGVCPNYLFPYAGVLINQMLMQAAFPPIYLTPLDFVALYQQYQQQKSTEAQEDETVNTAQ